MLGSEKPMQELEWLYNALCKKSKQINSKFSFAIPTTVIFQSATEPEALYQSQMVQQESASAPKWLVVKKPQYQLNMTKVKQELASKVQLEYGQVGRCYFYT
jgi:hypothetical protein